MRPIARIRVRKFKLQNGRCHYCELPMWESDEQRLNLEKLVGKRRVRWLRSTAEHLHARCDGGRDTASNIVAAGAFCNQQRHRKSKPLPPKDHARRTRRLVSSGKWHCFGPVLQVLQHSVITLV